MVFLYERGFRFPSILRGGYELGERVIHKDERSWRQILDQTLEQLSPIAPSSVLIQTESAYIYHFDGPVRGQARRTKMAYLGNPWDRTVDYASAKDSWSLTFEANMVSLGLRTDGAAPAHASPGWNPHIYRPISKNCRMNFCRSRPGAKPLSSPLRAGSTLPGQIWPLSSATEFRIWLGRNG